MNKLTDILKQIQDEDSTKILSSQNDQGDTVQWMDTKETLIVFLPFLIDQNAIILKQSKIEAYNWEEDIDKTYLSICSVMPKSNDLKGALLNELKDMGIMLNDNYDIIFDSPVYIAQNSNQKVYCITLFLTDSHFMSDNIVREEYLKISLKNIKNLVVADVLTNMMLMDLRLKLKIN